MLTMIGFGLKSFEQEKNDMIAQSCQLKTYNSNNNIQSKLKKFK